MFKKVLAATALLAFGAEAKTEITIYNQNLALVKKSETETLNKGVNEITFEGVARPMRPESAFVYGKGIRVLEQSYDEPALNYMNMLKNYVGKEVKTVRVNPANGKNIFEKALLLAADGGMPVLKFDYGVESNFPGRVVFDDLPEGMNAEPVLKAKVEALENGDKTLNLAYLTGGLSWAADYTVRLNDGEKLALNGRVTLNNNSGGDFRDAKVSLMAGEVNTVVTAGGVRPMMKNMVRSMAVMDAGVMEIANEAVIEAPEALSGSYLYTLPDVTTLKNGQMKQVSFLFAPEVDYRREGVFNSTLYLGETNNEFKNMHPNAVYHFTNNKDNGLGLVLPKGKISFYETDKNGSLQFIGENTLSDMTTGEEAKLSIGKLFDVYAEGTSKLLNKSEKKQESTKEIELCDIYETTMSYELSYKVVNNSTHPVDIVLKQPQPSGFKVLSETVKGAFGNGVYEWRFTLNANDEKDVGAKVEKVVSRRQCK